MKAELLDPIPLRAKIGPVEPTPVKAEPVEATQTACHSGGGEEAGEQTELELSSDDAEVTCDAIVLHGGAKGTVGEEAALAAAMAEGPVSHGNNSQTKAVRGKGRAAKGKGKAAAATATGGKKRAASTTCRGRGRGGGCGGRGSKKAKQDPSLHTQLNSI